MAGIWTRNGERYIYRHEPEAALKLLDRVVKPTLRYLSEGKADWSSRELNCYQAVFGLFCEKREPMTWCEIAEITGFPEYTIRPILCDLEIHLRLLNRVGKRVSPYTGRKQSVYELNAQ
jgi:hypothetical protein